MRLPIVLAASALVLAANAGAASAPTLVGHVSLQSMEPQCGKSGCAQSAQSLVLRFRNAAKVVRSVKLDAHGNFAVTLRPGTYRVSTIVTEASPDATITPSRIQVRSGHVTRITFAYRPGR